MAEGPFDRFLGPWHKLRESENVEDRRDDPWPWHPMSKDIIGRGTPTLQRTAEFAADKLIEPAIPPVTRLSRELGAGDVGPITSEELMKFMMDIEMMNPYEPKPQTKVPPEMTLERARRELKENKR